MAAQADAIHRKGRHLEARRVEALEGDLFYALGLHRLRRHRHPSSPGVDAPTADFVEHASFNVPEIDLAAGDVDNDGDVDLYMTTTAAAPSVATTRAPSSHATTAPVRSSSKTPR